MAEQDNSIKPEQTIDLLKELHILTRDGKLNQDSRRKLKQVYHLCQFIQPLLNKNTQSGLNFVDHGAGKSYLGFILYDLYLKKMPSANLFGVEARKELVETSKKIANQFQFDRMHFLPLTVQESMTSELIPNDIHTVMALHACDTATDDAIEFALQKNAQNIVLIPCCQAEVAAVLKKNKPQQLKDPMTEIWRHAIHTREFGSHLTNVLRCLRLEAMGYQVTVTEFTGLEHSLKNELIIGSKIEKYRPKQDERLHELIEKFGLDSIADRFKTYPPVK